MEEFPKLRGRVLKLTGVHWKRSAADVILSNIGWIAVTAGSGSTLTLKAYTPNGAGLYLREPALLPTSVRQRGMATSLLMELSILMEYQKSFHFFQLLINWPLSNNKFIYNKKRRSYASRL